MKKNISAAIFDMDGLMFDSERLSMQIWRKSMADFGYRLKDHLYISNIGKTVDARCKAFKHVYGDDFPFYPIKKLKDQYFEQHIKDYGISPMPGLIELVNLLEEFGIKRAIASSSEKDTIIQILERIGISEKFQQIISGEDVDNGKPAPDIFLKASKLLMVTPEHCIVFEDSNAGVSAAHDAGMMTVMVPNLEPPSEDSISKAHEVFADLFEVKDFLTVYLAKPS